ncbi:MAG: ATP-binding protein, partial [Saprospiraceae bacterium]|nr:ATP-binding protein [Saprospiraceae bacterium]
MKTEERDPLLGFAYRAYIKSVYIHLPCYRFRHKPADNPDDHYFVGREKVESQLLNFLKNGMDSGAYLVTGFRGMGKTSLVKKTIERFIRECKENDKRKIKRVSISFGQKDLKELDILRQIANEVRKLVREDKWVRWYQHLNFKTGIGIGFIIFLILSITLPPHSDWWEIIKFWIWSFEANVEAMIVNLVISTALSSLIFMFVVFCFSRIEVIKIADAIEEVYDRCSSQITKESGTSGGSEQFPFGFSLKQVKSYPIASSKEISNELIDIIRDLHAQDWKLIFTFDELDKVENSQSNVSYYEDMEQWTSNEKTGSSLNDIRERKMMVLGILSSLKYLITEAPARFIFIAGSEMFDAALADISDRQS